MTAQLWSIFYGLKLAWESHRTSLVLETDCPSAIGHVLHPDPRYPMADLVSMIKSLRVEAWDSLELECISESANAATSALSSHCLSGRGGLDDIVSPPAFVMAIIFERWQIDGVVGLFVRGVHSSLIIIYLNKCVCFMITFKNVFLTLFKHASSFFHGLN